MTQSLEPGPEEELCRILVIGVGGAGNNAVNNMIEANLQGVGFIVANTDHQALHKSVCTTRIQLGRQITAGLGAGGRPEIGRKSAEEAVEDIVEAIGNAHMLFIAAGMGGGTGTGAAPVIARIARERGVLTVGVVTRPFDFEGKRRQDMAAEGIAELRQNIDALVVVPNQNLFNVANENTTFAEAFKLSDDVLYCGVRSITEVIRTAGTVNLDFADVRTIMSEMGQAMMGTGEAAGNDRAIQAAEAAISSPLLDDSSVRGARAALVHISGSADVRLHEVDAAQQRIKEELDADANIIWGFTFDQDLEGSIRVSVIATGMDGGRYLQPVQAPAGEEASRAPALPGRPRNWEQPGVAGLSRPAEAPPVAQPQPAGVQVAAGAGAPGAQELPLRDSAASAQAAPEPPETEETLPEDSIHADIAGLTEHVIRAAGLTKPTSMTREEEAEAPAPAVAREAGQSLPRFPHPFRAAAPGRQETPRSGSFLPPRPAAAAQHDAPATASAAPAGEPQTPAPPAPPSKSWPRAIPGGQADKPAEPNSSLLEIPAFLRKQAN